MLGGYASSVKTIKVILTSEGRSQFTIKLQSYAVVPNLFASRNVFLINVFILIGG